jgi:hypothetical protein
LLQREQRNAVVATGQADQLVTSLVAKFAHAMLRSTAT